MKDTRVVLMTTRGCRDAQYRVDKAFSRVLGVYEKRREKNEDEVRER